MKTSEATRRRPMQLEKCVSDWPNGASRRLVPRAQRIGSEFLQHFVQNERIRLPLFFFFCPPTASDRRTSRWRRPSEVTTLRPRRQKPEAAKSSLRLMLSAAPTAVKWREQDAMTALRIGAAVSHVHAHAHARTRTLTHTLRAG